MTLDGAAGGADAGQARDVQPEHGLDELQHLAGGGEDHEVEASRGRSRIWKGTVNYIFRNTFQDIEGHRRSGWASEPRHTFRVRMLRCRAPLQPGAHDGSRRSSRGLLFVQTIFGILGGIGAEQRNLMFMRETADRLFGDQLRVVRAGGRAGTRWRSRPWRGSWAATCGWGWRTALYIGKRGDGGVECAAGWEDPAHSRGAEPRDRHAGGGAGDPAAQGRRSGGVLATMLDAAGAACRPGDGGHAHRYSVAARVRAPSRMGKRRVDLPKMKRGGLRCRCALRPMCRRGR